jgi:hypothetical protein
MEHDEYQGPIFPGEIRADEDHMARYDIDRWLETGDTHHFTVHPIVQAKPKHNGSFRT